MLKTLDTTSRWVASLASCSLLFLSSAALEQLCRRHQPQALAAAWCGIICPCPKQYTAAQRHLQHATAGTEACITVPYFLLGVESLLSAGLHQLSRSGAMSRTWLQRCGLASEYCLLSCNACSFASVRCRTSEVVVLTHLHTMELTGASFGDSNACNICSAVLRRSPLTSLRCQGSKTRFSMASG